MNEAQRAKHNEYQRKSKKKHGHYQSYKQASRTRLRLKIARIKESRPCADCGFFFPAAIMEFDHRPDEKKLDTVSRMVAQQRSWKIIEAEMAKCDLVCANDHRYRTHYTRKEVLNPTQKAP